MPTTEQQSSLPPFPAYPAVGRYVPLGTTAETLERICRAVIAQEAISLLIGPPGLGKSLLCHLLVQRHRETHDVVILNQAPIVDKQSLIRHLLHHLGADFRDIPESDLHLALVDRVCGSDAAEGGLLIIVDEAQSLSQEVLEAVRMVTNITDGGHRRVTAVMAGGPKMDDLLAEPSMESFTQRVATRCYLHPMNWEETKTYVHRTIRECGSDPEATITDGAISALHHATAGVPRLVNQMMTQAIDCAAESDIGMIDEDLVGQAWATLQQLPSPMVEEKKISSGMPIEFGELGAFDDSRDELTLAPERPVMVEEPDVEIAPTPEELFGEFDDEESIPVGQAAAATGTVERDDSIYLAAGSLEASLHDEIVGMSASFEQFASHDDTGFHSPSVDAPRPELQINDGNSDDAQWLDDAQESDIAPESSGGPEMNVDNQADEFDGIEINDGFEGDEIGEDSLENEHLLAMDAPSSVNNPEPSSTGDDSDMLIIQPDIELGEDVEACWKVDDTEDSMRSSSPSTIDIQSVMERMRAGG